MKEAQKTEQFYSKEFRLDFLKLLATNKYKFQSIKDEITEDIFPEYDLKILYKAIKLSYEEVDEVPTKSVIEANLDRILNSVVDKTPFKKALDDVFNRNIKGNESVIFEKAVDWIKRRRLIDALVKSVSIIKEGKDLSKVKSLIENALNIKASNIDYKEFGDLNNVPFVINMERGNSVETGFIRLDECLSGGYAGGEIHIVLGGAKSGKTSFCVQIGVNALKQFKTVIHITLEPAMSESLVQWKYGACITGLDYNSILENSDEYKKRLSLFKEKYGDNLFIKKFPVRRTTTTDIEIFIEHLINTGKISNPDLIIIDYDDLLMPTKMQKSEYENIGKIYEDLASLSEKFKAPILTPAQVNRVGWAKSLKGEIITSVELAHSALKKMHCSSIITLNPMSVDKLIVYVDTVRVGKGGVELEFLMDLARNRFVEFVDGKPYKKYPDVDDELEVLYSDYDYSLNKNKKDNDIINTKEVIDKVIEKSNISDIV
jgi:replicative DNA helicase